MLNYQVKIGLVPLRRDCTPRPGAFNWEIAEERGRAIVDYIQTHYPSKNLSFADLKGVIPVETFYAESDVEKVAAHMRREKVDAILLINANFGCEEAAALLAQALRVPVLLWAPLDERFDADGMRYTDSQCGVFGISRQLQRYNIPFTFMNSCRVDSPEFAKALERFARVTCMVKNFRGMRIGQVGMRPKIFCSVIFNEGELMQRFGLHIIPINNALIAEKFQKIMKEREDELALGEQEFLNRYDVDDFTRPLLKRIYAFVLLFKELFEEYNLDVISSECWTSMEKICGVLPCAAYGFLLELRKRYARRHHHGAALLRRHGTTAPLLRRVYHPPPHRSERGVAMALRPVPLQPAPGRSKAHPVRAAPVVPGQGRQIYRSPLRPGGRTIHDSKRDLRKRTRPLYQRNLSVGAVQRSGSVGAQAGGGPLYSPRRRNPGRLYGGDPGILQVFPPSEAG